MIRALRPRDNQISSTSTSSTKLTEVTTCSESLNMLLHECASVHDQHDSLLLRIDSLEKEKHELRA